MSLPRTHIWYQRIRSVGQWLRVSNRAQLSYTSTTLIEPLQQFFASPSPLPVSYDAAVMMLISNETQPKVLLTLRASNLNSHAGEVSFAGGKKDPTDSNAIATALRETHEELGIDPDHIKVLGVLPSHTSRIGLQVVPVVGLIEPNQIITPNPDEVADAFWVPLAYLVDTAPSAYPINYKGAAVHVPAFNYTHPNTATIYIIWGLTGRMLSVLLSQVYGKNIPWPMVYKQSTLAAVLARLSNPKSGK